MRLATIGPTSQRSVQDEANLRTNLMTNFRGGGAAVASLFTAT